MIVERKCSRMMLALSLTLSLGCSEKMPRDPIGEAYLNPPPELAIEEYERIDIQLNKKHLGEKITLIDGGDLNVSGFLVRREKRLNSGTLIFRCLPPGSSEADWVDVVHDHKNQFVGPIHRDGSLEFAVKSIPAPGQYEVRCYQFVYDTVTGKAEHIYSANGKLEIVAAP